jgi:hypothetical protein
MAAIKMAESLFMVFVFLIQWMGWPELTGA